MDNEDFLAEIWDQIWNLRDAVLNPSQKLFEMVYLLEADVNNGGFNQYFFNSSGRDAPEVVSALRTIRANRCAAIVEKALKTVEAGDLNWKDDPARKEFIASLSDEKNDQLEDINIEFWAYPDDLSDLLAAFVRTHSGDFKTTPT